LAIHPTAVISPGAIIADNVDIGPYAIVEDEVKLGPYVRIMAHAHITGYTEIGEATEIHMGAVIGHVPQDLAFRKKKTGLVIGKRNIIREYATVHRGTHGGTKTRIGDDNFIMGFVHVGHNCEIGNKVVIANATMLGGYVSVGDGAFISGHVAVHQFVRLGTLCMIGGKSRVTKDVPPYMLVKGESRVYGLNVVGLRRAGFSRDERRNIKKAHRILYKSGNTLAEASAKLERSGLGESVGILIDFLKGDSKRSYCAHI